MRLTQSSITVDGKRARVVEWNGLGVRVFDNAATALKLIELFRDEEIDSGTKSDIALRLLFPGYTALAQVEDLPGLVAQELWAVAGIDVTGEHEVETGAEVVDWEADAKYIEATLWQTYSMPFEQISRLVSLTQLSEMLGLVPHSTPFGQALYYRTAEEPKPTPYNQEEIKAFRKARDFWSLGSTSAKQACANDKMTDAFRSIASAAREANRNG